MFDLGDVMPVVCSGSEAPEEMLCKTTGQVAPQQGLSGIAGGSGTGWLKRLGLRGMRTGVLVLVEEMEDKKEQIEAGYKTE
jgi:hypothetical protein